jgi:hypothetical protein
MFRRGKVVGVQFHLETPADDAAQWADAYPEELAEFGRSREQLVAHCRAQEKVMMALAEQLIDNLLSMARESQDAPDKGGSSRQAGP